MTDDRIASELAALAARVEARDQHSDERHAETLRRWDRAHEEVAELRREHGQHDQRITRLESVQERLGQLRDDVSRNHDEHVAAGARKDEQERLSDNAWVRLGVFVGLPSAVASGVTLALILTGVGAN